MLEFTAHYFAPGERGSCGSISPGSRTFTQISILSHKSSRGPGLADGGGLQYILLSEAHPAGVIEVESQEVKRNQEGVWILSRSVSADISPCFHAISPYCLPPPSLPQPPLSSFCLTGLTARGGLLQRFIWCMESERSLISPTPVSHHFQQQLRVTKPNSLNTHCSLRPSSVWGWCVSSRKIVNKTKRWDSKKREFVDN